jgi:hypothetical protein
LADFTEQITDLAGEIPSTFFTVSAIHHGIKDVIEKVSKYQPKDLSKFSELVVLNNAGEDLDNAYWVLYVTRENVTCREISPQMSKQAELSGSIYEALEGDPVYYIEDDLLKILPDPGNDEGSITSTEQGTTASYTKFNVGSHKVVLGDYVEISQTEDYNGTHEVTSIDSTSFTCEIVFTDPQTGWYERAVGRARLVKPAITNGIDALDEIANFPESKYRAVVLFAAQRVLLKKMADLSLPTDVSLPSLPANISFDEVSEILPTFSEPAQFVIPNPPGDVDIDFSSIDEPVLFNVASPEAPSITVGNIDISSIAEPEYANPVMSNPDFIKATQYVQTDEDIELAQAQAQIISSQVTEFQAQVQNASNQYQNDSEVYKAKIQELIHNEEHKLQEEQAQITSNISKYQADIQKATQNYSSEFQLYARKVQKAIEQYGAETKYDIEKYSAQVSAETAKHSNELQASTQKFQNDLAKFNADLQETSKNNDNKLNKFKVEVESYTADAQSEISNYSAQVNKVVNEQQLLQGKYLLLEREYNEIFGVLTTESKTPTEQRSR